MYFDDTLHLHLHILGQGRRMLSSRGRYLCMCRPCPQGGNILPLRSWRRRSPKRPRLMNRDRAAGSIFVVGRDHPHPLYNSHAAVNASKYGVLSIQEWSGLQCDEELAAIRVRARVCHRYDSGSGVLQIPCYFIGKFASIDALSAAACTRGIASLYNKLPYPKIQYAWYSVFRSKEKVRG